MTDTPADTTPVRPGEELPADRLAAYLRAHLEGGDGPLTVEQFPHGHSNLTYLLTLGGRRYVLRRPPFGNRVKTAHDMGREHRVLSRLWPAFPAAPRPYLYCDDEAVLGAPFFVMEYRPGVTLRRGADVEPDRARRLCATLVDNLAALHAVDVGAAGLADLGRPEGYVARQVRGWTDRYAQARTDDQPAVEAVSRWLADHLPAESGAALVHNDYKFDNLVFDPADPTRLAAVLDWEMATVGDPLLDLGTTLGYWVEAGDPPDFRPTATGPTDVPGAMTRREVVDRYREVTGRAVGDAVYLYAFGLYKVAVIVQQIYARYVRGATRGARFARLGALVAALGGQAERAVATGRL